MSLWRRNRHAPRGANRRRAVVTAAVAASVLAGCAGDPVASDAGTDPTPSGSATAVQPADGAAGATGTPAVGTSPEDGGGSSGDDPVTETAGESGTAPEAPASQPSAVADPDPDRTGAEQPGPDDPSDAAAEPESRVEARPDPRDSRWWPAMLRPDDLPLGWSEVEGDGEGEGRPDGDHDGRGGGDGRGDGDGDFRICEQTSFETLARISGAAEATARVHRRSLFGPYATSFAADLEPGIAAAAVAELRDAVSACTTWTQVDDEGNEYVFTIELDAIRRSDGSAPGDVRTAFHLLMESTVINVELDAALWADGDTFVGMMHAGARGAVDRELSRDLGTLVADRMADLTGA